MKLIATLVSLTVLQVDGAVELSELRERGHAIREQHIAQEITAEQARRKVELLVKDLEAWAEAHDAELELKARTLSGSAANVEEPLNVNRCALFFDDATDALEPEPELRLCLIDLERSEIWGTSVLFCRYLCE